MKAALFAFAVILPCLALSVFMIQIAELVAGAWAVRRIKRTWRRRAW